MRVGSKSLIFGVHQFIWHPITVLIAWTHLFGLPTWQEFICIVIHDWGYWGCSDIDGLEGENHPELAARLADKWMGQEYNKLCLFHSRHYAERLHEQPSRLCWADKLSIIYDPWWLYLPRAKISGELKEYRTRCAESGFVPLNASDKEWYTWIRDWFSEIVTNAVYEEIRGSKNEAAGIHIGSG